MPKSAPGADHVQIPAPEIDAREREVLGADHQRQAKVAQHRRYHRHEEEEHHDDAVDGEQAVVGIRRH
jgi:hypothetical protein